MRMAQLLSRAKNFHFTFPNPQCLSTLLTVTESLKQRSSMKRRIPSGFSTGFGSGRGFDGVGNFGESKNYQQEASFEDTGCRKRLKYSHVHEKDPLDWTDDSSSWKGANSEQKSSGPKTSEYAFFQKIKDGVRHQFQSNPSHAKKSHYENFGSDEVPGGSSAGVHIADKHAVSSFLDEDVMPIDFNTFSSRVEPTPENPDGNFCCSRIVLYFRWGGRGSAAMMKNTSSRDANELYSKGLASFYSKRTENMNKDDMLSPNMKLKPLLFDSDIHKESHKMPQEPYEIVDGPCWDFDSAKRICSTDFSWRESDEIGFISTKNGDVPPYASERTFSIMDSPVRESEETDFMLQNLGPIVSDSAFPVKGYNTDSFSCRSDFPVLGSDSNMLLPDRKSMLQWNFDGGQPERDFMTSPNEEPIQDSRLLNFWPDDHHQQRNSFSNLSMGGALHHRSDCSEEFLNHNSNSYHGHFDEADAVSSMNNLHVSISFSGSYLNLPEYHTTKAPDRREDRRVLQQQHSHSDEASSIW